MIQRDVVAEAVEFFNDGSHERRKYSSSASTLFREGLSTISLMAHISSAWVNTKESFDSAPYCGN